MPAQTNNAPHSWSNLRRWTLLVTLAWALLALAIAIVLFHDLGQPALHRAMIGAVIPPLLLAPPLLFYLGLRLRNLAIANQHLGLIARTDSLTSCLNRGAFIDRVSLLLPSSPLGSPGALLMIDADNFKAINDAFGHDHGDEALTIIARSIRAVLRSGDLVGRMGGEEFGVFLPRVDQTGAETVAERIRHAVNVALFAPRGLPHPLSVSIGGVIFDGPASFAELFRIADQRLYGAKHTGRNCISMAHLSDLPAIHIPLRA